MSVDLPHLHRVLKDQTRARILELLDQRGALGYVEMLNLLEISHTGKINYHLKVLGDLIIKDEQSGKYGLSEKGKLAVSLLGKFETATTRTIKVKQLVLWLVVMGIAISSFDYFTGIIGLNLFVQSLLLSVFLALAFYYAPYVWARRSHFTYPVIYALFFGGIAYFVENLLLYNMFAVPSWVSMDATYRTLLTMPTSYAITAFIGYWRGKKRDFVPPMTLREFLAI